METVRIYPLKSLTWYQCQQVFAAQQESASAWNLCRALHLEARQSHQVWPGRTELQQATKGEFAMHSQSVQMVCHAFLQAVDTTWKLRQQGLPMRYPYRTKRFYPLLWPAQAVKQKPNKVILPMGRGRPSLVLKLALPENAGACKLVWKGGYELHVTLTQEVAEEKPGSNRATGDLGEIHQVAVTTNTGSALIVTGRGIRTLKRQRNQQLAEIQRKQARCTKGSRRWRKLQKAKDKIKGRCSRRARDLRHKGTRQVIDFCVKQQVGQLYIGNPDGVRKKRSGRHHNQRMSQWEYGADIQYLKEKARRAGIECFTGSERGTSSQCPQCPHRQKPKGRQWICKSCSFQGHRDLVGSSNMHPIAYGETISFPTMITYLRPGPIRSGSSSRLDTGQSCLGQAAGQPPGETQSFAQQQGFLGSRPHGCSVLEAHPLLGD